LPATHALSIQVPPTAAALSHIVSVRLASSRGDGSAADAAEVEAFAKDHALYYLGPVGELEGYHRFVAAHGSSPLPRSASVKIRNRKRKRGRTARIPRYGLLPQLSK
jgi:hypothetical protein